MSNLMQAAMKSGVSLAEFHADHFGDTVINVPQQSEALSQNDTEAFLKLVTLGTPAKFGDLKAQANRLDPEVRVATEFSDFDWTCDGKSVVDRNWDVLKGLFDRYWKQYRCLTS